MTRYLFLWCCGMFAPALAMTLATPATMADETFVSIHRVVGNRIAISPEASGGRGRRGGRAGTGAAQTPTPAAGRGRGRGRRGGAASQQTVLVVPTTAQITAAMRERRTFEFKVGAELPGGLQNKIFKDLSEPLSARIVTDKNRITVINVITAQTDINQSNTDDTGTTIIAVRPKRPHSRLAGYDSALARLGPRTINLSTCWSGHATHRP